MSRDQKDCLLLKGVFPPSLSLPAFLAVWASCRSNCDALCAMGTSFVRDSGPEAWVCPYSSSSTGFFPSWIFFRGEMVVFPHQQRQERCRQHAMLPSPFSPVQLQLCGTAPGRSWGSLLPSSIIPCPLLLLTASLCVLSWCSQGSCWAPLTHGFSAFPATNAPSCLAGHPGLSR